jgi:ABC-2 type transport system permease protein
MITFLQGWQETWRRIFTDPGARLLLVAAPVLYSLFYPLPYLREIIRDVPVAVVDFDRSSLSRQLVRYTEAHENLRVAAHFESVAEAEAAVKDGRLRGYLIVPAHFRQDVLRGRETTVAYGGDATYFLQFKQALAGFAETVGTLNAGIKARQLLAAGRNREQALAAVAPATLRPHPLGNTREGYAGYLIPGVFLIILQQTLLLGVGLLRGTACEDGLGTLLLSRRGLAGVVTALVTLYAAHAAFHLGFVSLIYDLPSHGRLALIALFLVPFLLACVLLALAASGCCTRREESIHLFLVTSVPVLFLAGSSWPFEMMPEPLQWLARLVPSTAGIQGVLRLNSLQASWAEVSSWWWLLWGLAALFAWPAWRSWRKLASPAPARPPDVAETAQ